MKKDCSNTSSRAGRLSTCFLFGSLIFLCDFFSKASIFALFCKKPDALPIKVLSNFFGIDAEITYAKNEGAAWGMFHQFPELLVSFRVLLILGLIIYLCLYNLATPSTLPLTCIISGAIGNVYDYFHYGFVIDMIQLRFWGYEYPIFNIADSAIFCGAALLIFKTITHKE